MTEIQRTGKSPRRHTLKPYALWWPRWLDDAGRDKKHDAFSTFIGHTQILDTIPSPNPDKAPVLRAYDLNSLWKVCL